MAAVEIRRAGVLTISDIPESSGCEIGKDLQVSRSNLGYGDNRNAARSGPAGWSF